MADFSTIQQAELRGLVEQSPSITKLTDAEQTAFIARIAASENDPAKLAQMIDLFKKEVADKAEAEDKKSKALDEKIAMLESFITEIHGLENDFKRKVRENDEDASRTEEVKVQDDLLKSLESL